MADGAKVVTFPGGTVGTGTSLEARTEGAISRETGKQWKAGGSYGGGGGDGGDGVEARISRIEAELPHLARDADLRELKTKVDENLPHLATKNDVTGATNKIYGAIAIGVVVLLIKDFVAPLVGN